MALQTAKGEQTSPLSAIELARSLQAKHMRESDVDEWSTSDLSANRMALLVLGIPAAARAQERMDTRRTHDRALDVGSLSRFNRDLSGVMLEMPPSMLPEFPDRLRRRSENLLYQQWGLPVLNEVQFNRITNGISREVAVLRALQETLPEEWNLRQGTPQEDMLGTDAVVVDNEGRELRMDMKTDYAFAHILDDLEAGDWITPEQARRGAEDGYVYSPGRTPAGEKVYTCVFNADALGKITDCQYEDPFAVFEFVEQQFEQQGQGRLRKLGRHAITQ
jgi:hypothetical protein